jgi:TolA-binding protein
MEDLLLRKRILQKIVANQVTKMRALVQVTADDDPQKPDFFFRRRRALQRQAALSTSTRRTRWIRRSSSCAPAARPAAGAQQRPRARSEAGCWRRSRRTSARHAYPKYERMDEVLFRLAALLTTAKKDEQAREYFHRLIKDYPNSKYIPDAYLAFAEHAFESGEMDAALKFYEKVEQFPKSSVYPYAAYKKGWCYINLGDSQDGARDVRRRRAPDADPEASVVAEAARGAGEGGEEGRREGVRAGGRPDKAGLFFAKVGGDYAPR